MYVFSREAGECVFAIVVSTPFWSELIVDASPAAIDGFLDLEIPTVRVRYRFRQVTGEPLEVVVTRFLAESR